MDKTEDAFINNKVDVKYRATNNIPFLFSSGGFSELASSFRMDISYCSSIFAFLFFCFCFKFPCNNWSSYTMRETVIGLISATWHHHTVPLGDLTTHGVGIVWYSPEKIMFIFTLVKTASNYQPRCWHWTC